MNYKARINSVTPEENGDVCLDVVFEGGEGEEMKELPSGHQSIRLSHKEVMLITDDDYRVTQFDGDEKPLKKLTAAQKKKALAALFKAKVQDVAAFGANRAADQMSALVDAFPVEIEL